MGAWGIPVGVMLSYEMLPHVRYLSLKLPSTVLLSVDIIVAILQSKALNWWVFHRTYWPSGQELPFWDTATEITLQPRQVRIKYDI